MKTRFSLAYVFTYVCILCIVGCSREDNGLHGRADAGEQIEFTATMGSTSAATKAPASSSFRISDTRFSGTITPITASSYVEDIAWTQEDVITIAEALNGLTSDYEVDPSGQLSLAAGVGLRWYDGEHRFLAVYPSVDQLKDATSDVTFGNSNTSYQMNIPMAVDPMPTIQYCYKWDQDNGIRPYKGQDGATKNELYYGPNMRYARMTAGSKVDAPQPQGVELVFYPQFSSVEVKLLKPDDMSGATVKLLGARLTAGSGAATDADLSGTPEISQPSAPGTTMQVKKLISAADRATVAYASNGSKHNYIDLKFKDSESAAETSSPELNESTPLSFTFLLLPVDVTQLELTLTLDIDGYQVFRTLKLKNADGWVPLAAGKKLTISNLQAPAVDVTPLTIEPLPSVTEATTITIRNPNGLTYQYSINGGSWQSSPPDNSVTITANPGDKVSLYQADNVALGDAPSVISTSISGLIKFNNPCYAYGNVMSLAGFANKLNAKYQFAALFKDNTNLHDHPEKPMLLPATTLSDRCYNHMFYNCTSLETAPSLPATTLTLACYESMFSGCTGLTTAPALPATTLANGCYCWMFWGCTSLTTAPSLPATTLAEGCYGGMFGRCTGLTEVPADYLPATTLVWNCYSGMFDRCTGLTTAPALPATTLAQQCYESMFNGCTSLVDAPSLPVTTLAQRCYESMFNGCTSLVVAPSLPATTLARHCYQSMFNGCTSLTTAPSLPATTLANYCYLSMFEGCTSLVVAPSLPATTLAISCYESMFKGCSKLNYIECMATYMSATKCLLNWVDGVATTGRFVKHPNAKVAATAAADTWAENSVHGIPPGWTIAVPFTVSESGKKVAFSPGNLQAVIAEGHDNSAEGARWQFADNQYDYPSRADGEAYSAVAGKTVDLFMHPESGVVTVPNAFGIPVRSSYSPSTSTFADWGEHLNIYPNSSPTSTPYAKNTYRTLTQLEWHYLLNTRVSGARVGSSTEDARYSKVTLNVGGTTGTIFGMLIYPNCFVWDETTMGSIPKVNSSTANTGVTYTLAQFGAMEAAGVVFLPAAGYCFSRGDFGYVDSFGCYWSASVGSSNINYAYYLSFSTGSMDASSFYNRYYGYAVRLVKDLN